jgi:hypothetical protein
VSVTISDRRARLLLGQLLVLNHAHRAIQPPLGRIRRTASDRNVEHIEDGHRGRFLKLNRLHALTNQHVLDRASDFGSTLDPVVAQQPRGLALKVLGKHRRPQLTKNEPLTAHNEHDLDLRHPRSVPA